MFSKSNFHPYSFQGHVLQETSFSSTKHLTQRMFSSQHMVVIGMQFFAMQLNECFIVINGSLWKVISAFKANFSKECQFKNLLSCKMASSEPISCISAATWWLGIVTDPSWDTQGDSWSKGSLGLTILPSRTKVEKFVPKKTSQQKIWLKKVSWFSDFPSLTEFCRVLASWTHTPKLFGVVQVSSSSLATPQGVSIHNTQMFTFLDVSTSLDSHLKRRFENWFTFVPGKYF